MIETSTKCSCGAYVQVSQTAGWDCHSWRARCSACYDPTDGAGDRAMLIGFGATAAAALLSWEEQHDAFLDDASFEPRWVGDLARQVSEEAERQRGWVKRPELNYAFETEAYHYGPESA